MTNRTLLLSCRRAGLLAAGLVLAGFALRTPFDGGTNRQLYGQAKPRTRMAVVGLVHDHVWTLAAQIASHPDAELVAIADPNAPLRAEVSRKLGPGARLYDDYQKMLDEVKPDAVLICTENSRHAEVAEACARRRIHVMMEKPMAGNFQDARRIVRAAQDSGITLMVNYPSMWYPEYQEAHRLVGNGAIGKVWKLRFLGGHQGPREIGVSRYFEEWLYDEKRNGGGALIDYGCYGSNWARWFLGKPLSVFASTRKLKKDQPQSVEDDAVITLTYPAAVATLEVSWNWPRAFGDLQLYGDKGILLAKHGELRMIPPAQGYDDSPTPGRTLAPLTPAEDFRNGIAYFLSRVRSGRPIEAPLSPEFGLDVIEILEAAKVSARTGREVALPLNP